MKKKLVALLLCLVMALSLIPTTVWAEDMSWTWTVTVIGGKYCRADGTESSTNIHTINRHLDNSVSHEIGYKFEWNTSAGGSKYNGGWQLCLTVDGEVVERSTAYIYTKDMSAAAATWTAPASSHKWNSSHSFTIFLSDYSNMAPSKPTPGVVQALEGLVNVYCTTENTNKATSKLISGTYRIGNVTGSANSGYTCPVTITNVAPYVALATDHVNAGNHDTSIKLSWNGSKWIDTADKATINVKCTPAPFEPSAPTAEELKDLTSLVKVHCTTVDSDHADQTYGLIDGSFTATTPVKRADGSYTSVVTIKNGADGVDKYVAKYNTDVAAGHVEDTGHGLTITVVWTNGTWGYGSDAADPATINVKCTPAPVEPSAPTWDDLETLLAGKVNMVCETNNSHNHTYGLLENTYNTSEVAKNANGVYTCTVTIINDSGVSEYIAKYNDDTNSKHEAGDTANDLTITLEYDKENSKWVVSATDNTAIIYVKCTSEQEAPEAPTAEDLENYKLVKVDCDTRISHGEKSYALLDGTFTTEVTFKDGIFQCVITITQDGAKKYVEQYSKDLNKTHSLKELKDATITLKYEDNSWGVDDNDNSASILAKCSTGSNTTTGTDDGKTVTSQKTFDAGIALYAGLSILSLTGGALVIRKRKEF